jgi:hypothetical protein
MKEVALMRRFVFLTVVALMVVVLASPAQAVAPVADGNCQPSGNQVVCTFDTAGSWSWTEPGGVAQATFDVFGAQGGASAGRVGTSGLGGLGGEAKATFNLQPTSQLQVNVGGEGPQGDSVLNQGSFNGGGGGSGGGETGGGSGGGASDVRFDSDASGDFALAERIIIAGGGGYYGGGGGGSGDEFPIFASEGEGGAGGGAGSSFVSPEGANKLMQTGVNSGYGKVTITYTPDTTSPTVKQDATSPTPQPGATGVRRTTTVKASFSEAVQASTLTSNVQLFSGKSTKPIKATLSVDPPTDEPTSVTLTPASKLDAKTKYTAKIKGGAAGVKDLAGNPLASDYSWSFTTRSM